MSSIDVLTRDIKIRDILSFRSDKAVSVEKHKVDPPHQSVQLEGIHRIEFALQLQDV